jgi:hypothetical protein
VAVLRLLGAMVCPGAQALLLFAMLAVKLLLAAVCLQGVATPTIRLPRLVLFLIEVAMSHFAEIDENDVVLRVIVAEQDFIDSGAVGDPSRWIQTSYNTHGGVHYKPNSRVPSEDQTKALRKNYANIGDTYDRNRDAFIRPQPFPSWTLDETSCWWIPPIPKPSNNELYRWDEDKALWVVI